MKITQMVKEKSEDYTFTKRTVREYTGLPNHHLKRYLPQLEDLEYIEIVRKPNGCATEYILKDYPVIANGIEGLLSPDQLKEKISMSPGR